MSVLRYDTSVYRRCNWCVVEEAAGGLSAEDRKKYAEQVTMQFWQAIGGNADEFEGLSSESD